MRAVRPVPLIGLAAVVLAAALAAASVLAGGAIPLTRVARAYPARFFRVRQAADDTAFAWLAASQVGYGPRMVKRFTSPRPFTSFRVVRDADGATVFTGGPGRDLRTDLLGRVTAVRIGDFTAVETPGRYHVAADNGLASRPFAIGDDVFDAAVRAVQRSFYYQRAFTAIEPRFAEGPWTHPSDAGRAPTGVGHGWHDAGDFSIYNAQAAASLFWLLEAYADFAPSSDATNIPESGNGLPDLLDEARWELEWFLSVQEPSGGFRNTTCLTAYGPYGTNTPDGEGPGAPPYVNGEAGTLATARAVGTLAFAATIYRAVDAAFASRTLDAAWRGWRYLESRPGEHSDGPTCPASRQDGNAEAGRHTRMYAAAGMLAATGDRRFDDAYRAVEDAPANDPSTFRFNVYAARLYLRATAADAQHRRTVSGALESRAGDLAAEAARHPFEWTGRYYWGSIDAGFERGGAFAVPACRRDPRAAAALCDAAAANVHYAFGRNLYQVSYVSGVPGVSHERTRAFHHWLAALDAKPFLFPGLVAGGPNATPEAGDVSVPHARPRPLWGYWGDPAMPRDAGTAIDGRFTDNDSYSTNEIDVVWQASTLYNLYFAQWLARVPTSAATLPRPADGAP